MGLVAPHRRPRLFSSLLAEVRWNAGGAIFVATVLLATAAVANEKTGSAARTTAATSGKKEAAKAAKTMNKGAQAIGQGTGAVKFEPVTFEALGGWADDDHLEALAAFAKSCTSLAKAARSGSRPVGPSSSELLETCTQAVALIRDGATEAAARSFFEARFTPHRVVHPAGNGLLTGYYEPVIEGSRTPDATFSAPVMKRPADLMNLVPESERGAKAEQLTHARRTSMGWEPYPTRQEIDQGALAGQELEFAYLRDPVDLYFMQVQGSGRIALPDGGSVRVTYDGKNGHPYTSVGRYLIDSGLFPADRMSLQALKDWLRAHPDRMRDVLWQNRSYVFFRELAVDEPGPLGVLEIPLTPGRSLAVDTAHHAIGLPVYVSSVALTHAGGKGAGFHRLMIAQDVGSAIRGPERGDIYFGSGTDAGALAGITKHQGNLFALLPRGALRETVVEAEAKSAPAASRRAGQ